VAEVVELLPGKQEALSSNTSTFPLLPKEERNTKFEHHYKNQVEVTNIFKTHQPKPSECILITST
jgi:hypothetical protein